MDFTPLVTEIMKAGPWALVLLLVLYIAWAFISRVITWGTPVVNNIVEAHLSYLKSVAEGQDKIHDCLANQTTALKQNNEILDRLDTRLEEHQNEKLKILANHTEMIRQLHSSLNNKGHKPD